MKSAFRISLVVILIATARPCFSQAADINRLTPDPEKEKKFSPYVQWRHGGAERFAKWKEENTLQYYKELWYFSQSFYVRRNYLQQGLQLDESIIDISRFESSRKQDTEAIVVLPGFKDVLVLLPASQLIYTP